MRLQNTILRPTQTSLLSASLAIVTLLVTTSRSDGTQPSFKASKPNIVFILADDWGMGDVKCYGGDRCKVDTPSMDALASKGMRFLDAHSSSSVCTPTRYSILTGRYNWRSELKQSVLYGYDTPLIDEDRETVAELLREHGYATAAIGKWHLGLGLPTNDGKPAGSTAKNADELATKCNIDWNGQITGGPTAVGFDYFWGISASLDMPPYIWIENDHFVGECTTIKAFQRRGPAHAEFEAVDVLPTLAEKAVDYVTEQAKSDKPFFMYMPLNSPHTPILPSKRFQGKSKLGKYGDFVMETDWAIGQVVKAIEDAGVADNTLIIVTADNGCSPAATRAPKNTQIEFTMAGGVTDNADKHYPSVTFRGHKADIYEGGHRVPFIARWDNKVAAGTTSANTLCLVDLFATCANINGLDVNETAAVDSFSFLPALLQSQDGPTRTSVVHHSINGSYSLRRGDWKLVFCPGSGGWSQPRPKAKSSTKRSEIEAVQLFNLKSDHSEQTNVAKDHSTLVAELTSEMKALIAKGRSTPGPQQSNDGAATPLYPKWLRDSMN